LQTLLGNGQLFSAVMIIIGSTGGPVRSI